MATLQIAIRDRLAADAALTAAQPGGLGFKVWSRWLTPSGPGATPEAFDAARGGRLLRNVVVTDGGEVGAPARQPSGMRRWDSFPQVYVFAEAHEAGKQAARDAVLRVERLLAGWEVALDGATVGFLPDSVLALDDSEQFPGNIVLVARWRATGARQMVPA